MKKYLMMTCLGLLVLLAGCGNDDDENKVSADGAKVIDVTTPPTSKNLSWQEVDGEILGYEPGVLGAVDEKGEEYECNIQAVADSAQETGLKTGKYQWNVGGLYPTAEREEQDVVRENATGRRVIEM